MPYNVKASVTAATWVVSSLKYIFSPTPSQLTAVDDPSGKFRYFLISPGSYTVDVYDTVPKPGYQATYSISASACDCNGNSIHDRLDIFNGASKDENENTTPDECEFGKVGWTFKGIAQGGQISATIQGWAQICAFMLPTTSGESAATVVSNVAASININT